MYHNSGAIVKGLATLVAALMMIACVVGGIFFIVRSEMIWLGLAIIFGGCLVSWLACLMMAAFGELVNNSYKILKILTENKNAAQMVQPMPQYIPVVRPENTIPVQHNEVPPVAPVAPVAPVVTNTTLSANACPNCGSPRKGSSPFCAFCGTKF